MRNFALSLLAAAAYLSALACATPQWSEEIDTPRLGRVKSVVFMDPQTIEKYCPSDKGIEDDGTPSAFARDVEHVVYFAGKKIVYHERVGVRGCNSAEDGNGKVSIYFAIADYYSTFWRLVRHEICHAGTGLTRAECSRLYPSGWL